jgi:uncharacterized protein YndB with AHSA1/START domain
VTQQSKTAAVTADEVPDTIERSIDIDASAERVWDLVSEPGWFINSGEIVGHVIEPIDDERVIVHDKNVGRFVIKTLRLDPPRYASFTWETGEELDGTPYDGPTTVVEFFVNERPGGATLRVVESGFAAWGDDAIKRRKAFDENSRGWQEELAEAKRVLEDGTR